MASTGRESSSVWAPCLRNFREDRIAGDQLEATRRTASGVQFRPSTKEVPGWLESNRIQNVAGKLSYVPIDRLRTSAAGRGDVRRGPAHADGSYQALLVVV